MTEQPMTGFTLTIDGDPDAVEAVWKAVQDAMGKLYERAAAKAEREWFTSQGGLLMGPPFPSPVLPVRGTFQIRERGTVSPEVVVVT